MHSLCPPLVIILINTHRKYVPLFMDGCQLLLSEGTTHGDPLAIANVIPLIEAPCDQTFVRCGLLMMPLLEAPCVDFMSGGLGSSLGTAYFPNAPKDLADC